MGAPTVTGLQIAPATRLAMRSVDSIVVEDGRGIVGDRYHGTRHRHLTIQSAEELAEAEVRLGGPIDPVLTRRNVTVSHGLFDRTPGARLQLGPAVLEVVRDCAPCKLLEDDIGREARRALHRRAGVVCRVVRGGTINLGDELTIVESTPADEPDRPGPAQNPHTT